jgi:hypothetical protein
MPILDNYNIIKLLGEGYSGKVYLIVNTNTNKKYALKRQKVYPDDWIKKLNNPIWYELNLFKFIKSLDKSDKNFFMKKYQHKFDNNCSSFVWTKPDYMPETKITKILEASKSCLDIVSDLKDGDSLYLIKHNLINKVLYSFIIQFLYCLYILHNNDYYHYDNNSGNICFVKNKKKYIIMKQLNIKIKSKYQFSLIDYESTLHKSYELSNRDSIIYQDNIKYNMDLSIFIQKVLLKLDDNILDTKNMFGVNSFKSFNLVARYIYNNNKKLYNIIKSKIIDIYGHNIMSKLKQFEYGHIDNNNISRVFKIENEISQFVAILDKKLFCQILGINYFDNLINSDDLLYMKYHYTDLRDIITYIINTHKVKHIVLD